MTFSKHLRSFAEGLAPDHDVVQRAKQTIDEMSRLIQAHFKGRGVVDRITPFGSLPKKTSIHGMMDIDVIVYINNQHPPFHDIIEELYNILPCNYCQCGSECHCSKHEFGIKLCHDGFKIDLLPAVNFLPSKQRYADFNDGSITRQHKQALQYVQKVPVHMRHHYSTSLQGASVLFEKERDSFSHSLSRLAKYWSSKVPVDNIIGRSSIMEYMGAYAADQQHGKQNIVEGFRRFLKLFESSDSLDIYWLKFYNVFDVPLDIMIQRPLLLDPCNPYNNLLDLGNNAHFIKEMGPYAEATLARLHEAELDFNERSIEDDIEDIFNQDYHINLDSPETKFDQMDNRPLYTNRIPYQDDSMCSCCSFKCCCCIFLSLCLLVFLVVGVFFLIMQIWVKA